MIKVCVLRNYDYPDLKRQTPGKKGIWENIEFVFEPVSECDYLVVFNYPKNDISIRVKRGGSWLFVQEPPYSSNNYLKRYFSYFDKVFTGFPATRSNIVSSQALLPWHLDQDYDFLKNIDVSALNKRDEVVWITSNLNKNAGHALRLEFMKVLGASDLNVQLYGRGIRPIDNKWDVMAPAKYTIAIENYRGADYWTEKLADALLAGSVPIYYGCTNLEKYLPKGSFIPIDIQQPQKAIDTIRQCIKDDHWANHLPALLEARALMLDKYQLFPGVKALIDQHLSDGEKGKHIFSMPAYPMSVAEKMRTWSKQIFKK